MPNLDYTKPHFPQNIVNVLVPVVKLINPDSDTEYGLRVVKRPLHETDDSESVGITAMTWTPDQESLEMMGGLYEPTLQNYSIAIQAMVKDSDEERAIATHSVLSSELRRLLYGAPYLQVALRELAVAYGSDGPVERVKKWRLPVQNFQKGTIDGSYILLSSLELVVQTEIQ